jgi:hypothetical protein
MPPVDSRTPFLAARRRLHDAGSLSVVHPGVEGPCGRHLCLPADAGCGRRPSLGHEHAAGPGHRPAAVGRHPERPLSSEARGQSGATRRLCGVEHRRFIHANRVGAYFLGMRLSCHPLAFRGTNGGSGILRQLELGGHISRNHHPNMLFQDTRTVIDLDRRSWSLDLRACLLGRLRLAGLVGEGAIEDDFDGDGRTDYAYRGWELKAMLALLPERLEAGARYDVYWNERSQSGDDTYLRTFTAGINWMPATAARQARRGLSSPARPMPPRHPESP